MKEAEWIYTRNFAISREQWLSWQCSCLEKTISVGMIPDNVPWSVLKDAALAFRCSQTRDFRGKCHIPRENNYSLLHLLHFHRLRNREIYHWHHGSTHQTLWLTATDSFTRVVGILLAFRKLIVYDNYCAVHLKTGHCKYISQKTIAFWAMMYLAVWCSFTSIFRYGVKIVDSKAGTGFIKCKPNSTIVGNHWTFCFLRRYKFLFWHFHCWLGL